jgi:hypothetical protein
MQQVYYNVYHVLLVHLHHPMVNPHVLRVHPVLLLQSQDKPHVPYVQLVQLQLRMVQLYVLTVHLVTSVIFQVVLYVMHVL